MLRFAFALTLIVASADPLAAQSPRGTPASRQEDNGRRREPVTAGEKNTRAVPLPSIGVPLPTIGLPLPTIGLPLPTIGLPPPSTGLPAAALLPGTPGRTDPRGRPVPNGRRGRRPVVPVLVPVPVFVPGVPGVSAIDDGDAAAASPRTPVVGTGRVLFDVKPVTAAQVYVDGYYVGTPDDYRLGLELPSGSHVVEIQAPGFQSDTAPLNISDDKVVQHRVRLEEVTAPRGDTGSADTPRAETPPVAPAASPYYVIRGCYLGNVPPAEVNLPPGCDPKSAVVVRP